MGLERRVLTALRHHQPVEKRKRRKKSFSNSLGTILSGYKAIDSTCFIVKSFRTAFVDRVHRKNDKSCLKTVKRFPVDGDDGGT